MRAFFEAVAGEAPRGRARWRHARLHLVGDHGTNTHVASVVALAGPARRTIAGWRAARAPRARSRSRPRTGCTSPRSTCPSPTRRGRAPRRRATGRCCRWRSSGPLDLGRARAGGELGGVGGAEGRVVDPARHGHVLVGEVFRQVTGGVPHGGVRRGELVPVVDVGAAGGVDGGVHQEDHVGVVVVAQHVALGAGEAAVLVHRPAGRRGGAVLVGDTGAPGGAVAVLGAGRAVDPPGGLAGPAASGGHEVAGALAVRQRLRQRAGQAGHELGHGVERGPVDDGRPVVPAPVDRGTRKLSRSMLDPIQPPGPGVPGEAAVGRRGHRVVVLAAAGAVGSRRSCRAPRGRAARRGSRST